MNEESQAITTNERLVATLDHLMHRVKIGGSSEIAQGILLYDFQKAMQKLAFQHHLDYDQEMYMRVPNGVPMFPIDTKPCLRERGPENNPALYKLHAMRPPAIPLVWAEQHREQIEKVTEKSFSGVTIDGLTPQWLFYTLQDKAWGEGGSVDVETAAEWLIERLKRREFDLPEGKTVFDYIPK